MPGPESGGPNGPIIEEVVLKGCEAADADDIAEGLSNRPPLGWFFKDYVRFDEIAIDLDRRRIETYYRKLGHFGIKVQGPERLPGESFDHLRLVWTIEEGPVTRLTSVRIEGAPQGLQDRLRALLNLDVKKGFSHADYLAAKPKLRAYLVREGYAHAQVKGEVSIHRPRGEAEVLYTLVPGPLVHLGVLTVEGQVRTPTTAVTYRQTWQTGDVFSARQLERMRSRLYEVDQYSGVRLDYAKDTHLDVADIVARVEEAEQNELQLGGGLGLDRANLQIRLRARYKRRSFPLAMTNLELQATPEVSILRADLSQASFTPQARATWTWHDFIFPRLEFENSVGINFRQLEAFTWFGPDVGQVLSRPFFDDRLRAGIGWHLFNYSFSSDLSVAVQDELAISNSLPVLFLEPSITFDGRDDSLAPTRGLYARVAMEIGFGMRSAAGGYTLVAPELRGYVPLGRLVLAARTRLATTMAGKLPAPRRFFAGGATSQRGFSQRRLSPSAEITQDDGDVRTVPIGGETVLEAGAEARLRIVKLFGFWLGVVAFIDGADLVDTLSEIDPLRLHWAAGGGLRYYTPIGAVRADFGFRLNRRGSSEPQPNDSWAWHLTLGEAF